jgi:hypothetical protein
MNNTNMVEYYQPYGTVYDAEVNGEESNFMANKLQSQYDELSIEGNNN